MKHVLNRSRVSAVSISFTCLHLEAGGAQQATSPRHVNEGGRFSSGCCLQLHFKHAPSPQRSKHSFSMSAPDQSAPYVRKAAGQEGSSPSNAPQPASAQSHVTNEIVPPYSPHTGERSQCGYPEPLTRQPCACTFSRPYLSGRDAALVTRDALFSPQVPARRHPRCQRRPRFNVPPHPRSEVRRAAFKIVDFVPLGSFADIWWQWRRPEHSANLSGWSDWCAPEHLQLNI
jgi:hypothetical protein